MALDFLPYAPQLLVVDALTYPSDLPNINVPDPHPVAVLYAKGSDEPLLVARFAPSRAFTSRNRWFSLDQTRYNVSASIIKSANITSKLAQACVIEDILPQPTANISCNTHQDEFEKL